jgi:serine/threonine-protein kinase
MGERKGGSGRSSSGGPGGGGVTPTEIESAKTLAVDPAASAPTLASTSGTPPPLEPSDVPQRGEHIDRFLVLEMLGSGGMAVVLSAMDPDLDRKVALKLLRAEIYKGRSTHGQQRLLREAQAMARLQHPNVVAVHQAGTWKEHVYLAMEHVDGQTLGLWLKQENRPWREIVAVFLQAGAGLAAAHAAGLVHRDFKPDNVLVGRDGRVRVSDFGLVSTPGSVEETPVPTPLPSTIGSGPVGASLTRTGMLLGTPAYMPPEQHLRKPVDARADQFSFCVSLWEALYGERPFAGDTYRDLLEAILSGKKRPPPADSAVPDWLRRVLERGLEGEPADRYPSMAELLAALASDPEAVRKKRLVRLGLAAAFVLLAGVTVLALLRAQSPSDPCQATGDELAGAWDAPRREAMQRAFAASRRSYAEETFTRAAGGLDGYARSWSDMRGEVCRATRVQGRQSQLVLDLRTRCLDRRRDALAALTQLLGEKPDPELVDHALEAVAALPPLAGCADVDALAAAVPLPDSPAARAAIETGSRAIDRVEALLAAGRPKLALPLAVAAVEEARRVAYPPLLARALVALGHAQLELGEHKAADEVLGEALRVAASAHDDELVVFAWVYLIRNTAADGRYEPALALRMPAEVALARAGDDEDKRAQLWAELGSVLWQLGRYDQAQDLLEKALVVRERRHGGQSALVADTLEALGNVRAEKGDYAEARALLERTLAIREVANGPRHPRTGSALNDLAMTLRDLGEDATALPYLERGLSILEEALGPEAADVARLRNNLGLLYDALGQPDKAIAAYRLALAGKEKALGPEHPSTALTLNNLAASLAETGSAKEAEPMARRALAIYVKSVGPDHPDAARSHATLAGALRGQQRFREARDEFAASRTIWEKVLGPDHMDVSFPIMGMATCELALGHPANALPLLEHTLRIRQANPGRTVPLAEARWMMARTLIVLGQDRPRALQLAEQARAGYALAGGSYGKPAADIEAWLAAGGTAAKLPRTRWDPAK